MSDNSFLALTKPFVQALRAILPPEDYSHFQRIKFKDRRWADEKLVLIQGAITTVSRYKEWEDSLAHLTDAGIIMCYGEKIGTREDLEFLGPEA